MLMADKSIKTRVQMKRGTAAEWALATGFKPLEGEIIFYSDLNKIKIGTYREGTTDAQKKSANHTDYLLLLSELAFLDAGTNQTVKTSNATFGVNDVVEFVAGSNVSISGDTVNKKITISATDTNSETTLTITNKSNTDTADLVYAVTNLVEGGTKGHAITPTYVGLPTKAYVDKVATGTADLISSGTDEPSASITSQYYFKYN
jgi:hypothetical protein